MIQHISQHIKQQRGFTLIEVLVAALVLSIGLLGLAALSATSLKLNMSSAQRTQAANLSYAITDAMRANKDHVSEYIDSYDVANCQNNFVADTGSVAEKDIAEWRNSLACALTSAEADIKNVNGIVTVTICWDEARADQLTADDEIETDPLCDAAGINGTMSFSFNTEL